MNSLQSKAPIRINIVLKQYRSPALRFTNNSSKSFHAQSSIMVQAKYHAGQTVEYKPVGGMSYFTSQCAVASGISDNDFFIYIRP